MTDDLNRKLENLAPDLATDNLLAGAKRKRNRGRVLGSSLAIAVVATATFPVVHAVNTSRPQQIAAPPTTVTAASAYGTPNRSPQPDVVVTLPAEDTPRICAEALQMRTTDRLPTDGIPENAANVWLCGDPSGSGTLGLADPLAKRAGQAVKAINALRRAEENAMCTLEGGLTYRLAVEYPDGTIRTFDGQTTGCKTFGGTRVGADELLAKLQGLWQQERAETKPTATGGFCQVALTGAPLRPVWDFQPEAATTGYACGWAAENNVIAVKEVALPDDLLRALVDAEWEPNELVPATEGVLTMVLQNQYGDPLGVYQGDDGVLAIPGVGTWKPDAATIALIGQAFSGLNPTQ